MAGVHPHLILKLLGQLPAPPTRETLASQLDQAFGPWAFALEDGRALSGEEAVAVLVREGAVQEVEGKVELDPAWHCKRTRPQDPADAV